MLLMSSLEVQMKVVNSSELAIALEYCDKIRAYDGKFVTFKGNSGIYRVNKVSVGSVTPDDRPHVDLRFNFIVTPLKGDKDLRFTISTSFSLDMVELHKSKTSLFDFVADMLKAQCSIIEKTEAIEILYAEKNPKGNFSYAGFATFQNGRTRYSEY